MVAAALLAYAAAAVVAPLLLAWFLHFSGGPGPASLPVIGHLHLLAGPDLLHIKLAKLADRFGPVVRLRAGSRSLLLVSSAAAARECFTVNDRAFASRPRLTAWEIFGNGYFAMPFAPYGPVWRDLRKLSTVELFSPRRTLAVAPIRDDESAALVAAITAAGAPVKLKDHLQELLLRVILRMIGGGRGSGFCTPAEAAEIKELVERLFYYSGIPVLGDSLPFLKWVDWKGTQKAMREVIGRMNAVTRRWVEERRKTGAAEEGLDFMDVAISAVDGKKMESMEEFTAEQKDLMIYSIIQVTVFGAMDTTTVTLEWIFAELLNNPRVLERAQAEIDAKVGEGRTVEESDTEQMPYLLAIVKEALRLHPAGPLLVPHEAIEDCSVAGIKVLAGTQLIVNAWKIHRDPEWWDQPLEFRPERFIIGPTAGMDMKGQHFQLIPFGSGRRACPGTGLALAMLHLTTARLLHAFEWRLPADMGSLDMGEGPGLSSPKAVPLLAMVIPRTSAKLYT